MINGCISKYITQPSGYISKYITHLLLFKYLNTWTLLVVSQHSEEIIFSLLQELMKNKFQQFRWVHDQHCSTAGNQATQCGRIFLKRFSFAEFAEYFKKPVIFITASDSQGTAENCEFPIQHSVAGILKTRLWIHHVDEPLE